MRSTPNPAAKDCRINKPSREWLALAAIAVVACLGTGCASNARVADAERQIVELQKHVVALEALLDDDDSDDDVDEAKLVTATTQPRREATRETLARLDARRTAHLTNLAHADMPAFRARCVVGEGHAVVTTLCMMSGPMVNTGRQLDLAINGNGFFRVKTSGGGVAYTRSGNLFVNANHAIVVGSITGPSIDPPLTLPPTTLDVCIANDGTVEATPKDAVGPIAVGRLELARFVDPTHLAPLDDVSFTETPASGPAVVGSPGDAGFGTLEQNFLESSNVFPDGERSALHDVERHRDHLLRLVSSR